MKKVGFSFFVVVFLFISSFGNIVIGVSQIVEHPALNSVFEGIKEALKDVEGIIFDHQIAQGSFQTSTLIAQKFQQEVDIIIGISTPSAQAAVNLINKKPVVFSAVTDPVSAGLISRMGKNEGNVVGISDMLPVELHMRLIKNYFIDVKKIGLLYNTGEDNSKRIVDLAKIYSKDLGLETIEITGSNINELITGINSRGSEADIFYIFTDNLVASSIGLISETFENLGIPAIAGDIDLAKESSVLGFGFDYKTLGIETGNIVRRIIEGENIENIPSTFMPGNALILYINESRARQHNITFPIELIERADIIE